MGFAYVEPSIEELNRRIAGGMTFIQSDLSGTYREYYVEPTPFEIALGAQQAEVSMDTWNELAVQSQINAQIAYAQRGGYIPSIEPITDTQPGKVTPVVIPGQSMQVKPGGGLSEIMPLAVAGVFGIVLAGWLGSKGSKARRKRAR